MAQWKDSLGDWFEGMEEQWDNLRSQFTKKLGLNDPVQITPYRSYGTPRRVYIKGRVLEIGESTYTTKFGSGVVTKEVLHYTNDNPAATIIGDLAKIETLPEGEMDCFICTQTFNFIYDFREHFENLMPTV